MSVQEYLDLTGADATPALVYDAGHGFIKIEGYTPPKVFVAKPKAEKAVKEPKAPKAPKEPKAKKVAGEATEAENTVAAEVVQETID
jgi:hypothetical protein